MLNEAQLELTSKKINQYVGYVSKLNQAAKCFLFFGFIYLVLIGIDVIHFNFIGIFIITAFTILFVVKHYFNEKIKNLLLEQERILFGF